MTPLEALEAAAREATPLDEARATIRRLNRRCQEAESAIRERLAKPTDPRGFGRILANGAASMYERERDEALARLKRAEALAAEWERCGWGLSPSGETLLKNCAEALRAALAPEKGEEAP